MNVSFFNIWRYPPSESVVEDGRGALKPQSDRSRYTGAENPANRCIQQERAQMGESRLRRSGVIPALVRCAHGPLGPRPRPYEPDSRPYALGL